MVISRAGILAQNAELIMKKLAIFNLETNSDSPVLAVGVDWILELSKYFSTTEVASTYVGETKYLGNIRVFELGGGSTGKRLRALTRLIRFSIPIILSKDDYTIFHHMSPRTAVFPGAIFRLMGIPQGLWYSHASKPLSLKVAVHTVNRIFTSAQQTMPISSPKNTFVGHGIPIKRFTELYQEFTQKNCVLFVGRINPVKRLDFLVSEVSRLEQRIPIVCIGPEFNGEYAQHLRTLAHQKKVDLTIKPSVYYQEVPQIMSCYKYFYSGTKGSVDKVALEASLSGCLILTTEEITLKLSGMDRVWKAIGQRPPQTIGNQIKLLAEIGTTELKSLHHLLIEECRKKNDLSKTIFKIVKIMEEM